MAGSFSVSPDFALLSPLLSLLVALLSEGLLGEELSLDGGAGLDGVEGGIEGDEEGGGVPGGVAGGLVGGVGGCGVVGLLALGQPLSSRQADISPSTPGNAEGFNKDSLFRNNIGFHNIIG